MNTLLAAPAEHGVTARDLAEEFGLSERHARRILADMNAWNLASLMPPAGHHDGPGRPPKVYLIRETTT